MGIPVIGCSCAICSSNNPKNKRTRTSALIEIDGMNYLIDAGPDVREQLLKYKISHLEGLLLTHFHHDHTAGLDELRAFRLENKRPLPLLLSKETFDDLNVRFHYMFTSKRDQRMFIPQFEIHLLEEKKGEVQFQNLNVQYISYQQLNAHVLGFRFGSLAYIVDIKTYNEEIFEDLRGVKTLVLSALRNQSSPMHFTIEDAIYFANRVGAEKPI